MFSFWERWITQRFRVCLMARRRWSEFGLHSIVLNRQDMFHISIISTGELWLSALTQVERTSAQMICVGEKRWRKWGKQLRSFVNTQKPSLHHFPVKRARSLIKWQTNCLEIYSARLSGCSWPGGGKPEASVVKETPKTLEEKENNRPTRNRHILICGILSLDQGVLVSSKKCCWLFGLTEPVGHFLFVYVS